MLAQVTADDALDLVRSVEQLVEGSELREPFDRRLLPHFRHAGKVVARLAHQRGDVGILLRTHAVALLHGGRVVPLELRDTLHVRVQQCDLVVDELDGVAIAGHHQDLVPLLRSLSRQGREDVVGFDPLFREHGDRHRSETVLQQRDLPAELLRRLGTGRLVLRILVGAEGVARRVEGDSQMRGLLGLDEVDQHREEAVDGVRVLVVLGREVVDRKGEEGAIGERVAVDDHEGRLCGVRHPVSLTRTTDTR